MREEGGWGGAQGKDILTDRSGIDTVAPALMVLEGQLNCT